MIRGKYLMVSPDSGKGDNSISH